MESEKRQKVLNLIDERKDTIIEFLQKLVSFPSVTGDEWEIQNFIADKLHDIALKVDMWEPDHEELKKHPAYVPVDQGYEKRPNVVGLYKGTGDGKSLLFNGHVDVIPAGPSDSWDYGPFSSEIHDRRLYGRGSSDMKSGLAAMTMALDCLLEAGIRLKGDIILEYVMDEELSGNGTLACVM
ncbi:MAG: M20/M25/M40 family metallo-hydrolase, partial [Desulfatiglandales bacterium]